MRIIAQRCTQAQVEVEGKTVAAIGHGLLLLVGVGHDDSPDDAEWLAAKVARLRVFDDPQGTMNLSLLDTGGDALAVSQFTLMASTRKGNRPSYVAAAPGELSKPLFDDFAARLQAHLGKPVPKGVFGAHMQVSLCNDGPVTIVLDSKLKF